MQKIKVALCIAISIYLVVITFMLVVSFRNLHPGVVIKTTPGNVVHIEASESAIITTTYPITFAPEPMINVTAGVNVYAGPGDAYAVIGHLRRGEVRRAIQRTPDGDWWQICCVAGQVAWIANKDMMIDGDYSNLPVYVVP